MAFVSTSRGMARSGRAHFVPGSLACAATARHLAPTPPLLHIASTLKLAPGFTRRAVTRLAPPAA